MRTFIAIDIPSEVKDALAALQNELRGAGADVAWVNPESIHITLKFLGEIEKKRISEVEQVCVKSGEESPTFKLSLNGPGVFPNPRHPRVLWVGLSGDVRPLERLQEQLEERLAAIGFDPEEMDFRPHLTIGRVKSNRNAGELIAQAERYSVPALSFLVEEIVVMKSDLHQEGAIYKKLSAAKLKV
ncbi:MAG TPA: RNA 2',3'-cyclic phosphodiesterase [Blastocatellia bacterium]|nr:RNA 2',3'-cyclic phosphodiesterase [Blastocatellia bacterium]